MSEIEWVKNDNFYKGKQLIDDANSKNGDAGHLLSTIDTVNWRSTAAHKFLQRIADELENNKKLRNGIDNICDQINVYLINENNYGN